MVSKQSVSSKSTPVIRPLPVQIVPSTTRPIPRRRSNPRLLIENLLGPIIDPTALTEGLLIPPHLRQRLLHPDIQNRP